MPSSRAFLSLVPLLAAACVTAPPPAPAAVPAQLELRLAAEDRALVERLLARLEATSQAGAALVPPRAALERRPSVPRDTRTQLGVTGPVTFATHVTGAKMYEGAQIERDGRWLRHGAWQAWYADGTPWEEGAYDEEQPDGPWRWWYEDGTPQAQGRFARGLRVGPWTYYHPNGRVWAEGRHESDRPVGVWRVYGEQGELVSEHDHGD